MGDTCQFRRVLNFQGYRRFRWVADHFLAWFPPWLNRALPIPPLDVTCDTVGLEGDCFASVVPPAIRPLGSVPLERPVQDRLAA
jgi:hypothetical protein